MSFICLDSRDHHISQNQSLYCAELLSTRTIDIFRGSRDREAVMYDNTLLYNIGAFARFNEHPRGVNTWNISTSAELRDLRWPDFAGQLMQMEVEPKDSVTAVVEIEVRITIKKHNLYIG